jgi:RluA family pseudouridine synthase
MESNLERSYRLACRVDPYRNGWTLEEFLAHRFRYHPVAIWRERLASGAVEVNGRVAAGEQRVQRDDEIAYTFLHTEPDVDFSYEVLHEDEALLVVSKSGNLPVHAGGKFIRNTLIAMLRERWGNELRLAHRLDRETSGIVLLAKSSEVARRLEIEFREGRVEKRYAAVLRGTTPDSFTVDGAIARSVPAAPPYFRVVDDERGKASVTRFVRVALGRHEITGEALSLVEVEPRSGRTNQIRVHAAHAGHPILGDKVYGVSPEIAAEFVRTGNAAEVVRVAGAPRHLLHCTSLALRHPWEGAEIGWSAPPAPDFPVFGRIEDGI